MTNYTRIFRRADGSFIVEKNGIPRHVPNVPPWDREWREISVYARQNPGMVENEKKAQGTVSTDELFLQLRRSRNARLASSDYLLLSDYPLPEEIKNAVLAYRQALRDLPAQSGAPWDGGGEATPWPELPDMLKKRQNVSTSGYTPGI